MSKKTTLTIGEVAVLNNELYSLMTEGELSFTVKYDISKLIEKTKKIVKIYREQTTELLKKYGICVDEKTQSYTLEGSDKIDEGTKELKDLNEKKETFTDSFKMKDFKDLKTENSYVHFMRFLDS